MAMNPRLMRRGTPPDFTLPKPNPNPDRMTDALWWYVCMCEALEPTLSENGGTYANKPGYHNAGENLPDHGLGDPDTDHSIRRAPDRRGPWWRTKSSGHDWTFLDAQRGDYRTINKYTKLIIDSMRSLTDTRLDNVYAYVLGQVDSDRVVEGYNEYRDENETSGDLTHLWHIHKSFRRDIIGNHWAMWKALTVIMGWSYEDWLKSTKTPEPEKEPDVAFADELVKITAQTAEELFSAPTKEGDEKKAATLLMLAGIWARRAERQAAAARAEVAELRATLEGYETHFQEIKAALSRIEESGS